MPDDEQLKQLCQGVTAWNAWREAHPEVRRPNLAHAKLASFNLHGANLRRANLEEADLRAVDLRRADLFQANLRKADLREAKLREAKARQAHFEGADLRKAVLLRTNLSEAHLEGADLRVANLRQANLSEAHLERASLEGAILHAATLVETNLEQAELTGAHIYGIAAWNPKLTGANQSSLVITRENEHVITVDDLKVAQFIYLLLNNAEIRNLIDTVAKKAVLILGRFTPERKLVLDALRDELRQRGYLPILFDFDKPESRDVTETVSTLAHMARFIIADITDAKSIPQELSIRVYHDLWYTAASLRREASKMIRYQDEKTKAYRILDLTSLTIDEFEQLVAPFEAVFARHMRDWTMEGKPRTARSYSRYANSPLPTPEDRLLFILSYLKIAALQVAHGAMFGLSQSNANKWIHVLLPVLEQTLLDLGDVPARHLEALKQRLLELRATEGNDTASPFFMTAPNVRLRAPKTTLSKKRIIAVRKSDTR